MTSGVAVRSRVRARTAAAAAESRDAPPPFARRTCVRAHNRRARHTVYRCCTLVPVVAIVSVPSSRGRRHHARVSPPSHPEGDTAVFGHRAKTYPPRCATTRLAGVSRSPCTGADSVTVVLRIADVPSYGLAAAAEPSSSSSSVRARQVAASVARPDGMNRGHAAAVTSPPPQPRVVQRIAAAATAVVVFVAAVSSLLTCAPAAAADTVSADVLPDGEVEVRVSSGNVTAKRTSFTSPDTGYVHAFTQRGTCYIHVYFVHGAYGRSSYRHTGGRGLYSGCLGVHYRRAHSVSHVQQVVRETLFVIRDDFISRSAPHHPCCQRNTIIFKIIDKTIVIESRHSMYFYKFPTGRRHSFSVNIFLLLLAYNIISSGH